MESDQAPPFESEVFGAPVTRGAADFGYSWSDRTYGLGALKIQWTQHGIQSLEVVAASQTRFASFESRFAASKSCYWLKLMTGEFITKILVRESDYYDQISALCVRTNMRRSQWCGSFQTTVRKITAPPGYYINMLHGSNKDGALRYLGAYFVPLPLREPCAAGSRWVLNSKTIGDTAYESTSDHSTWFSLGDVGAIVVTIDEHLQRVRLLSPVHVRRYLAVTESPLDEGDYLVALAKGELITALDGYVAHGCMCAIRLQTTHRTTEWLGAVPPEDAEIETRRIGGAKLATHIGGVFTMQSTKGIESIGVMFYEKSADESHLDT